MKWFLLSLLLTGCNYGHQKNLAGLSMDLESAKSNLQNAYQKVVLLEEAIAKNEIERIAKEIEQIEKLGSQTSLLTREQRLAFFHEQREVLGKIINNHTACSERAQTVLDHILTLITNFSDSSTE